LLICTSACAMHCRYCFRQNFDYETENKGFAEELAMIAEDSSLHEILLSGGDPLSLSNTSLKALIEALAKIPHLKRLRFHTRFPIGIPERIDDEFLDILEKTRFQTWFVIHTNHPQELDKDIFQALKKVQKLGIPVLNQTVLLKGVNDNLETLKKLCETLVDQGILPYYLHQLDRVQGSHHFEVAEERGHELIEELLKEIAGYAVPKYVREISGEPSKTPLLPISKQSLCQL
jgi:EF-P beta-lysylation protein EpmB